MYLISSVCSNWGSKSLTAYLESNTCTCAHSFSTFFFLAMMTKWQTRVRTYRLPLQYCSLPNQERTRLKFCEIALVTSWSADCAKLPASSCCQSAIVIIVVQWLSRGNFPCCSRSVRFRFGISSQNLFLRNISSFLR